MVASPYNIGEEKQKDLFYGELSFFTDKVLEKGESVLSDIVDDYTDYITQNGVRTYTHKEHLIECLIAGVLWDNYSGFFSPDSMFFEPLFNSLYKGRKRFKMLKSRLDSLRGKLSTSVLMKEHNMHIPVYRRFDYMNSWLSCSKEFEQELDRLNHWQKFIERKNVTEQEGYWKKVVGFARWFTSDAERMLGKYTAGWENFIIDTAETYENREDYIFCTRKPNEYHLNMVAAEVMNRALVNRFDNAEEKIVLLPTCMADSEGCKANNIDGNLTCTQCTEGCKVSEISESMKAKGFNAVLIPHSSGFSKFLEPWKNQDKTALVGVACVLNLLTGGYEMQKLNIPSQCVFLDSCSCKKHWLSGKPTSLNELLLDRVLYGKQSIAETETVGKYAKVEM